MKLRSLFLLLSLAMSAFAAGPRWVAGTKWTNVGQPMGWYRPDVKFFVDSGPLSSSVDHAAATAMVDAAAAVWNVSGVNFRLTDGGTLSEDVSGDNTYIGASGIVWPADVQSASYTAKQIAVVFDSDGSITETLLGSGASDTSNCRQNAVTETTDLFIQPGKIAHSIIIVNGRCSGSAPEKQLQLQYQMERVLGRVIGIGWSQTNDNVFTGTPAPTYAQQMHWPIMHPIDVLCGPYTYQCLPQPFVLRDDDLSALRMVYTSSMGSVPAGTVNAAGAVLFPAQGMNGVNVTVQRSYQWSQYGSDAYQDVSGVSGYLAAGDRGNPVSGAPVDTTGTNGNTGDSGGNFLLYGIPALPYPRTNLQLSSEPINPLYVGSYAVGPFHRGTPLPSGSAFAAFGGSNQAGYYASVGRVVIADAASDCNTSRDGTEIAPAEAPVEGVWSGRVCGVQHSAWTSLPVHAGRSATIEVTALDEASSPTTRKAMPVLGVWHMSDALGTSPTMAAIADPFNAMSVGMTQARVNFSAAETVRMVIADQRGDGRPDYAYRARILYADSVFPARLSASGGAIRIVGMGFAPGNTVMVGGVAAQVTSISATEIDAVAPPLSALHGVASNDITVTDLRTGGNSIMTAALTYTGAAADVLTLVGKPPLTVPVGSSAQLAVSLTDGNGKPAANSAVVVSVAAGTVLFGSCGASSCTLLTDATGIAMTTVTPQSAGTITVTARAASGSSVAANFTATQTVRAVSPMRPTEYVASGAGAEFHSWFLVTTGGAPFASQPVVWTSASTRIALQPEGISGGDGMAMVSAAASLRDGEVTTVQACAWAGVCGTQNVIGVAAANLRAVVVSGDAQSIGSSGTLGNVVFRVQDASGHPVAGAAVSIYQAVTGWQPACANSGRCATPPMYGKATATLMSDDDGLLMVTPLQYERTAAVTKITASVGTQSSVTAALVKTP